jgi:hypothetical protein
MSWRKLVPTAFISLFVLVLAGASVPVHAYGPFDAACNTGSSSWSSSVCKDKSNTGNPLVGADGLIPKVITLLDFAIAIIAIFVILISGFRFIFSQGESSSITGARNGILYAVIGLGVALVAQLIVVFVVKKL